MKTKIIDNNAGKGEASESPYSVKLKSNWSNFNYDSYTNSVFNTYVQQQAEQMAAAEDQRLTELIRTALGSYIGQQDTQQTRLEMQAALQRELDAEHRRQSLQRASFMYGPQYSWANPDPAWYSNLRISTNNDD